MDVADEFRERRPPGRRHIVDQFLATVLLGVLLIPFALAASVVWFSLGRPFFFAQTRAGLNATPFRISKLRTMRELRTESGALLPDAQREVPMTRLIRRTRLDEIPQLLAILRSEMAFIGPRPLLPVTIVEMGPLGIVRCSVRPGLTGWAQVNGNTLLDNDQKLALDIWYVDNRSLALDALILWRTVKTVILGECIDQDNLLLAEKHVALRRAST